MICKRNDNDSKYNASGSEAHIYNLDGYKRIYKKHGVKVGSKIIKVYFCSKKFSNLFYMTVQLYYYFGSLNLVCHKTNYHLVVSNISLNQKVV